MPTPSTRTPVRIARGTYSNLNSSVGDLQEGEVVYATDLDIIYVKEGASLVPTYAATTAKTDVAQTFTAAQRGNISAQGSVSGTVTLSFASANNFSMTLPAGGSITLANPTNLTAGQSGVIVITQNGTTAATVAYGSNWKFSGGTPTMSTGLSSVSVLAYFVESTTRISAQLISNVT